MSLSHRILKVVRLTHLYLGVFTAPALLFFALTGGLQTFSLHETTRGSSYKPPAWLATMAQLHKKQTTVMPVRKQQPSPVATSSEAGHDPAIQHPMPMDMTTAPAAQAAPSPSHSVDAPASKPSNPLPLKIFFVLVALSLFVSTLTGLYMAYKYSRNATRITAILLAGVLVPIVLALL